MPEPSLRSARLDDDGQLAVLDRATWSTLHAVVSEPQPPYGPFFDERYGPDGCLVAELDGRIVGYVRLVRPTPLASNAHVLAIRGFAVAEDARGQGIGRILIRAAVEEARGRGARRLTLRVLGHNTPARALYESEGFLVEGVLPEEFHLDGKYVDDVFMGRGL
ncbi:GNAT family N-acetyltransferase [Streptomyces pluripotens]|uniref:GNAT family N-acetyltransferase n=1 Tax=Streptomyces pluripotens TaxID=1355015 RepID=A0A221P7P9_9ACTN|nr:MULTISPECIES: GNAT family N-acetyltransferase [Streptomyces]ASN28289.1 GNAT family N-acetyltransferase [Streptomyces pluripotens]MCH0555604.1 GNAT family N-acetyltransferase [Streptomyces sp. MUM 16J]